jgi:small subunit ribosomal protein S12
MPNGMYTARKLKKIRRKMRLKSTDYVLRLKRRTRKQGPLEGAPMGRGIVLAKVGVESKQPNSDKEMCQDTDYQEWPPRDGLPTR